MPTIVTLPDGFQWVTLPLLAAQFLINSQHILVMKYRFKAKIEYPQMYAEKAEMEASTDAYKFNCMQRAHQNTLESINLVTTCTIIIALSFPILGALVCGSWVFGRMLYTRGYLTGADLRNKKGGFINGVSQIAMELTAAASVGKLLGAF